MSLTIPLKKQVCNLIQAESFKRAGVKLESQLSWYLTKDWRNNHIWRVSPNMPLDGLDIKKKPAYSLVELDSMANYMKKQADEDNKHILGLKIWSQEYLSRIDDYRLKHPCVTRSEMTAQVILEAINCGIFKGENLLYET